MAEPIYYKSFFSIAAVVLTLLAFWPYIKGILRGSVKPHVFSWLIWGISTAVVFLAQLQDKGGVGAWPTGISAGITFYIAWLAYRRRADISITAADRVFLSTALLSLPLWYFTADPLWTVIIITTVDLLGFGPTVRKAYVVPHSESLAFFSLFVVRNALALLALEHYSLTTVLFHAAVGAACLLLIILIAVRRWVSGKLE